MNVLQTLADLAYELHDSASNEGCDADLMVVGSAQLWHLLQEVKRLKSLPADHTDLQCLEMVDAFQMLLDDVENINCCKAAYGFPVEDEQHPFHLSVLRARAVLANAGSASTEAPPAPQFTWQPIETAPKDRWILGCDPSLKVPFVMGWNIPEQRFVATYGMGDETPSHWMDMPQLPSSSNQHK